MFTKKFRVTEEFTLVLTTEEKIGVFDVAECSETYPVGEYTASSYGEDKDDQIILGCGGKKFSLSMTWGDIDDMKDHELICDLHSL